MTSLHCWKVLYTTLENILENRKMLQKSRRKLQLNPRTWFSMRLFEMHLLNDFKVALFCPDKRNLKPARRLFYKHTSFYKTCSSFLYWTLLQCWRKVTLIQNKKKLLNTSDCGFLFMRVRFLYLFLLLCILIKPLWKWYQRTAGVKKTAKRRLRDMRDSKEGTGACTYGGWYLRAEIHMKGCLQV